MADDPQILRLYSFIMLFVKMLPHTPRLEQRYIRRLVYNLYSTRWTAQLRTVDVLLSEPAGILQGTYSFCLVFSSGKVERSMRGN